LGISFNDACHYPNFTSIHAYRWLIFHGKIKGWPKNQIILRRINRKNSHKGTRTQRKNLNYHKTSCPGGENFLLDKSLANML